jgi:uncharacterized protein YdeI (YjbR/CyaY-like superfamily)
MARTDDRVDVYIARAAPFARPILERLRRVVHAGCPSCSETIKWGMPFFVHEGRQLAFMAAFKAHCAFGFGSGKDVVATGLEEQAMGQLGRLTRLQDLPPRPRLLAWVRRAAALIEQRMRTGAIRAPRPAAPPAEIPAALAAALAQRRHAAARRHFESFTPTQQRDYVDWIADARRDETRARRLQQALEWLAEGKRRNWKYERR